LRGECFLNPSQQIKTQSTLGAVGKDTAVITSIVLDKGTALIASLPNGRKKVNWVEIDQIALEKEISELLGYLQNYDNLVPETLDLAGSLYNRLIRPFAEDLAAAQVKTLVFVQDGVLRSLPMSVLYDGKEYLVQKYAIGTTPSLNLTNLSAGDQQKLRALALGLTEAANIDGQAFPGLANVGRELDQIYQQVPNSKKLLNEEINLATLKQAYKQDFYSIIHIATHAQFGIIPEDTFLVTGKASKLTITDLEKIIRFINQGIEQVDLLTLSACQTAVGDDRTTLGLAGIAVQAGIKTTLASLWSIDDAVTADLISRFYQELVSGKNKSQSLREAQIALIEKKYAPMFWAPFILIGNWM
jgi:CHAT domain-containing protein